VPPVVTDVVNTDTSSVDKATTTVGLDFGMLTLDNGDRLRLFGTPGQARFDFLWKILARNTLGS
jgi:signal recognition particle receptor subunit beta